MLQLLVPLAGIVATFMSLTIILYVFFTTRNKERLALIARNQDASIFKSKRKGKGYLRLGVLMIFFGIGAILGIALVNFGFISEEMVVLGICPIFIGFGMIVAHRMIEDRDEEDLEV